MAKRTVKRSSKQPKQVFAWQPVKNYDDANLSDADKKFGVVADRLMNAVTEVNAALKDAHANSDMRVELWAAPDEFPRQYHYRIYRLTHSVMTFKVQMPDNSSGPTPFWKRKLEPVDKPASEATA